MSKNPFQNFVVRVRAGETVFREADAGATMYIVQSGAVRLCREVEGQRRDLGTMGKGDFFGEMSILEGLARTHTAEALEDSELIEISNATFDKMIKGNIEIAIRMLRKLSIRLRQAESQLAQSGTSSAARASVPTIVGETQTSVAPRSGSRLEAEESDVVFPVGAQDTMIGRYDPVTELKPDVDLTDLDLKRSVSRRHARIVGSPDGFSVVEEIGALNGTFVNSERLAAGEPRSIQDGDRLGFGMVKLVFRA